MRIALSGAANTGKTTLARDLSEATNLPFINERFDELPRKPPRGEAAEQLAAAFNRINREKLELEHTYNEGFVSDRCPIDIFNYWISFPVLANRPDTQDLYRNCRKHANTYDYIVFISWGSVAYREIDADKPKLLHRNMNPWMNLTRHSSTLGLAYSWVNTERILVIPKDIIDRKERVDWLLGSIANGSDCGGASA